MFELIIDNYYLLKYTNHIIYNKHKWQLILLKNLANKY